MVSVIIVAGGKGLRMGERVPKQFIPINGRPILMRTIDEFHSHPLVDEVIVVLPLDQGGYWQQLCGEYDFCAKHKLAVGGETRFHSVKSGLSRVLQTCEVVLVHDAVRPFITENLISEVVKGAKSFGAVIPVVEVEDSLRALKMDGTSAQVDRAFIKRVQTPQGFLCKMLEQAYNQPYSAAFGDDASVVEALGENVSLIEGEFNNIKITTKFDMLVAKAILEKYNKGKE